VRAVLVVMLDVDPWHLLQVPAPGAVAPAVCGLRVSP
jgi:hypothetical protein